MGTTGVTATPGVTLTYDQGGAAAFALGRLTSMTDGVGSETYSYNNLGEMTQLQKIISSTTYTTGYAYNLAGELNSITYPSGRIVQQSFDNIGRLCSVGASGSTCTSGTTYATGFAYNAAFQVTGFNYGNGVAATFGYTPDRLLLQSLAYTKGATTLFSTNYWYKTDSTNCPTGASGNNGQIQCITDSVDSGRTAAYSYDTLYRLTSAVTNGSANYVKWGLSWTYDRYANRLSQSSNYDSPPTNSVAMDATTNHINSGGYGYDANGNMTNDGLNSLVYDGENRVLSAANGGASGTYTYDGNNLRVQRVSGSTTTVYIFSGSKVIAEYDNGAAAGSPSREYVYSGGAVLAKIDSSGTKYYHQDHLSNRVVTDSGGNKIADLGHYPFGESWYNSTNDKLFFTTYERDSESGNDYAMMRSYVNRLARFSSPDPHSGSIGNPQSLNHYAYVANDAANLVDPLGLDPSPPTFNTVCAETADAYVCWGFFDLGSASEVPLLFRSGQHPDAGGPDFAQLKAQALKALTNPDCAGLFGKFPNAVTALFSSIYSTYTPRQANPYPSRIQGQDWTGMVNYFAQNADAYGRTFWSSARPGGITFFTSQFSTYAPGFPSSPNGFSQMTAFLHEFEHGANHSHDLDSAIDASPAAYAADYQKINKKCTPPQIETQSAPITGELTPP